MRCHPTLFHQILLSVSLVFITIDLPAFGQTLSPAIKAQQKSQRSAIRSQKKVIQLDDETQQLLDDYRATRHALEDLQTYNVQLKRQTQAQAQEISSKQAELSEIEVTRRRIVPFMLKMLDVLAQFIQLDVPFLPQERHNRIQQLQIMMDHTDISLAEKYRRLLEAYRVEAEYGHNIETYHGKVKQQTVEFLRLGRIGLYYLTLNGDQAAYWHSQQKHWIMLSTDYLKPIKQAILMAKKQLPPNLVKLPLPAPEIIQ